jgi:predicted transcriptional regulator
MAHLNVYLSKDREKWLREHLESLATQDNRSLSYIVEEALVQFVKSQGKHVPQDKRKDHRRRAA